VSVNNINLIDKLYHYINDKEKQKDVEVKPDEFKHISKGLKRFESPIEIISKDKNCVISKENEIVCDNILMKFFDLDDEKFSACLEKMSEWGFEICFKEFIINYYFKIIKDNRLRQYIVYNFQQLILMLKERVERNLLNSIKMFNFTSSNDNHQIELIKNEILGKETAMLRISVPNFKEFKPIDNTEKIMVNPKERRNIRLEILNRLRYENRN
jgi:hypothetical protein